MPKWILVVIIAVAALIFCLMLLAKLVKWAIIAVIIIAAARILHGMYRRWRGTDGTNT